MNRLRDSSSPYLRQHAENPVHWQPWDEAAFDKARRENKPVFLSVGYSSCHWCHVMERESFEDEGLAKKLNQNFVSIKVDREEMPDVDDVYMAAVQLATGRGGWPMSVFMTPDKKPFFAGTYFPLEDREGYLGFRSIVERIARAWREQREDLMRSANEFARGLQQHRTSHPAGDGDLDKSIIDAALEALRASFDPVHGGFGFRPKFPPHTALMFLLRLERGDALKLATTTLDGMMKGGIHDHVGGGFHRYSTDEKWLLPHFEKMLYDNALLLKAYAIAYKKTGNEAYRRVCQRIVNWSKSEMASPDGLYYSALDADSAGEEGLYYTWTKSEIESALGPRAETFAHTFGIHPDGNYYDEAHGAKNGRNILHANTTNLSPYDEELSALIQNRARRTPPGLDDKVLIAWNGLMLGALAIAGETERAIAAARAILAFAHELPHQIVKGKPAGTAFLDCAYVVEGLLDLADATGESKWRDHAERLYSLLLRKFRSPNGGWHFTSAQHEKLFGLHKPVLDASLPSPNGIIAQCGVRLGKLDITAEDLIANLGWMQRAPEATQSSILAAKMYFDAGGTPKTTQTAKTDLISSQFDAATGRVTFVIRITPPNGWRVSLDAHEARVPLSVQVTGITEPQASISADGAAINLTMSAQIPPGESGEAAAHLRLQLCTDTECRIPEERVIGLPWRRVEPPTQR